MANGDQFSQEPMLKLYIYEASTLLEQLDQLLLEIESKHHMDTKVIDEIFRIMHTIKATSRMMMFLEVAAVAHAIEDLFFVFRKEVPENIDFEVVCSSVLEGSDFIKNEVRKADAGLEPDGTDLELVEKIRGIIQLYGKRLPEDTVLKGNEKYYIASSVAFKNSKTNLYTAKIFFEDCSHRENIRALNIVHNLSGYCIELYHRPKDIICDLHCATQIADNGFCMYLSSELTKEEVETVIMESGFIKSCFIETVSSYENEILDLKSQAKPVSCRPSIIVSMDPAETKEKAQKNKYEIAAKRQNIISVDIGKHDILMDLVGEIVTAESMVTRNEDLEGLHLENFQKAARQLGKLTNELQDIVMSIRMVPAAGVFNKMKRIVRDMGKALEKEAELVFIGEETEMDKDVIDHLADPLMHLIRNCMDHGLESPQWRLENGKAAIGKITLRAENVGSEIIISVSDDGRGLDREAILAKARETGVLNRNEAEMSDNEIWSLILLPGFSTKEDVSEFSGRGVGMDVVHSNMEKIGGVINIESAHGSGTTFTIKIPLTLAIIDVMGVTVGNSIYTIPISHIHESLKADERDLIKNTNGNEMIMLRGECLPVIRLHQRFGVEPIYHKLVDGVIVVVETTLGKMCHFADCLLGEQSVVVKPLPLYFTRYYGPTKGVSGCTILGSGKMGLILDVNNLN